MTNLLYAFVLPVVEIFVGAYVMRHTSEPVSVAFYQLFMYIGIIATSFVMTLMNEGFPRWRTPLRRLLHHSHRSKQSPYPLLPDARWEILRSLKS